VVAVVVVLEVLLLQLLLVVMEEYLAVAEVEVAVWVKALL
jgi:hypothetical protein